MSRSHHKRAIFCKKWKKMQIKLKFLKLANFRPDFKQFLEMLIPQTNFCEYTI